MGILFLSLSNLMLSAQLPKLQVPPLEEPTTDYMGEVSTEPETYRLILTPLYTTHIYPEVNLFPEVNAQVQKIYKRFGDRFVKGEVLIQLDDRVFKGIVYKAEAAVKRANTVLAAKKQLYQDHIASLFDLREAEAAVATAQADLILAKRNLEGSRITAPYSGRVSFLFVEEKEIPQQGKEMMEIIYDRTLIAKFLVPSNLLTSLSIGQPVSIFIREVNVTVPATITRVGAFIDPSSSTAIIEAEIDNQKGELKAGMTGNASLKKNNTGKD